VNKSGPALNIIAVNPGEQLVEAAENLLQLGGSITRRNALRKALDDLPMTNPNFQEITRHWRFTPQCLSVIAHAASLATADNDNHIRIKHLEQAVRTTPKAC